MDIQPNVSSNYATNKEKIKYFLLHKMLLEFNSESRDKLDGCPFSNKETKKQKQKV